MTRTGRRIEVTDTDPRPEWIAAARAALEAGEIVLFPTESGYALAARGDDERALARLRSASGRAASEPLTWTIGAPAALDELGDVSPLARRLAARYWPGPLTLVLPGTGLHAELELDGWIGVRCVAHAATAGILTALPFPAAFASVRADGARTTDSDSADRHAGSAAALVFDGGRTRLAEASSVARIGRGRFELLREGLVDLRQLRKTAGLHLGFVCTGNTCRSPLAEGLARLALAERLGCRVDELASFGFELASMGVDAAEGDVASKHTQAILKDSGIDASEHRARAAQSMDLARFDHLYCMTQGHLDALVALLPPERARVAELLDPTGSSITDPIGGPREVYRRTAEQIRAALAARVREWA